MMKAALIIGLLALAGCTKAPVTPSTRLKLVCRDGDQQLVVLMDTLTKSATLANLPGAPSGTFTTTDFEYHFIFPETKRVRGGEAVVNRYDGQMVREMGKPPFALDGIFVPDGNMVHVWKCERREAKPLL